MTADVSCGAIVWAQLPHRLPPGREQFGTRPCVVVADPATVETALRSPVLYVAPLTRTALSASPMYPCLNAGVGGLPARSTVLLDQIGALDAARVLGVIGNLGADDFAPILRTVQKIFAGTAP